MSVHLFQRCPCHQASVEQPKMDGLLPVSRLQGIPQVLHCSKYCLTQFSMTYLCGKQNLGGI